MIDKSNFGTTPINIGSYMQIAVHDNFITDIYSLVDVAVAGELARLSHEEGITPSCKAGCDHCCRYHIVMNVAEAQTMAHYIRQEFSEEQIAKMQMRTHQWHEWDNSRPGRPSAVISDETDLSGYVHCCPLLVNNRCSVYPVRPVVCRAHYVSSHPSYCCAVNDPESTEDPPVVLKSVVEAVSPYTRLIRAQIENSGVSFSQSNMLLPQWLAIEMGWDFAILLSDL